MGYSVVSFVLREAMKFFPIYKISFWTVRFLTSWLINTTCFYQTMAFQLFPQTPGFFLSFTLGTFVWGAHCKWRIVLCAGRELKVGFLKTRVFHLHHRTLADRGWLQKDSKYSSPMKKEFVCQKRRCSVTLPRRRGYIERWLWWLQSKRSLFSLRTIQSKSKAKDLAKEF